MATADIERLAKTAAWTCEELRRLLTPPRPLNGAPQPPPLDPGTGPGFTRRGQAKHDLEFWLRQRDRLLDTIGEKIADGSIVV